MGQLEATETMLISSSKPLSAAERRLLAQSGHSWFGRDSRLKSSDLIAIPSIAYITLISLKPTSILRVNGSARQSSALRVYCFALLGAKVTPPH
jgi:hypothetical protein